jgi:predicted dehydrogenase
VLPELRRLLAETPPRLVRAAWHGSLPPVPWWRVQEQSGGQVVEQATHLFDLARFLLGEAEVRHAEVSHSPDLEVASVSTATLRFASGPIGVFTATCVHHAPVEASIEFHCDGRLLTVTNKGLRRQDADGSHETPVGRDPLVIADEQFLAAVAHQDPGRLTCSYEDAVRTQELCVRVRELAGDGG